MTSGARQSPRYRFGVFELDLASGDLCNRTGATVRLQPQPLRLLALLVSRPGELVTRKEIRQHLWNDETFVDFEHAVNFAVRQIRSALGDDARSPRYIETAPRRGYRFIAPVERIPAATEAGTLPIPQDVPRDIPHWPRRWAPLAIAGVFALAAAVSISLWVWSPPMSADTSPTSAPRHVPSDVPAAEDAYLKGRYFAAKGMPENVERAAASFEEAVKLDPDMAHAHAGLADAYQLLANMGRRAAKDVSPKARSAAERALELDPGLSEARMVLGTVLFRFDWNWADAEKALRAAVELDPASAAARHDYGWFLVSMNRFAEGVAQMRKAHELDRLSLRTNADIGWALLRAGQVDEAIQHMRRIVELEPGSTSAQQCLEAAYTYKGMYGEALSHALRAESRGSGPDPAPDANARRDPRSALHAIWRARLKRLKEATGFRPVYRIASYHALLGERDQAMQWLEQAFTERDPSLVAVHVDEAFKDMRGDPRFVAMLGRIGLPPDDDRRPAAIQSGGEPPR